MNVLNPYSGSERCKQKEGSSKRSACLLSIYCTLKIVAVRSSETSVNFYQTTCTHIPKDSTVHVPENAFIPSHGVLSLGTNLGVAGVWGGERCT
jgi:hypothetical protein